MTAPGVNMSSRAEALASAAEIFAAARARRDSLPIRQAAIEAHVPGGPSIEDLIVLISQQRSRACSPTQPLTAA